MTYGLNYFCCVHSRGHPDRNNWDVETEYANAGECACGRKPMPEASLTLQEICDSWDWQHIFKEYAKPQLVQPLRKTGATKPSDDYLPPYSLGDIEEVIASREGVNDGAPWVGFFKMKDGKFLTIRASCDYTGWGCQESGSADVANTKKQAVQWGLTEDERSRLGFIPGRVAVEPRSY